MNKKTKIICSMGPNVTGEQFIRDLVENGMDIARLNFSHGDHEEHLNRMKLIKSVRAEMNLPIAMLLDTKGPEIRTGMLVNDEKVTLVEGQKFTLTTKDIEGNKDIVSVSYENLPKDVKANDRILIDDGLIELNVDSVSGTDITCTVLNGGEVGSRKGINIPGVSIKLPALTEKDKGDIIFGIEQGVDFIAASFIRNAAAVREIKKILKEYNSDIAIIAKIENQEGIDNIDEIIEEADAIMVARGDLGVEVPAHKIPSLQKMIINKCNDAYKPVITATQMLDSMIRNPRPTRAEVTDVANAIYDGTDAIMLSGETAMGKYPLEAVKIMVSVAKEAEENLDFTEIKDKKMHSTRGVSSAICYASVSTAANLNAKYIVASSISGFSARLVSKFKPEANIIGLSPIDRTLRKMQLYWGVTPIKTKEVTSIDQLLDTAVETVKGKGLVEEGDTLILTAGVPAGITGVTNMIKVVEI